MRFRIVAFGAMLASTSLTPAVAGPFIVAGTDADDHGGATTTNNLDGWLFMQRAIENIGSGVVGGGNLNRTVVSLGSDANTQAGDAAASAFKFSALGAAWTYVNLNGVAAINDFFTGAGVVNVTNAGLIMLDSASNVSGGATSAELAAITNHATDLNNFLGSGGGLFSQANGYGFLSALVPSVMVNELQDQDIQLTASGMAAFPGLTNADLSAGPYHENFSNVGMIPVLGTGVGSSSSLNVIIGSAAGTITNPTPPTAVPEPTSLALFLGGAAAMGLSGRRRKVTKA